VKHLAALSTGELVANPRVKASNARALVKASRAYARTVKGSKRRERARRRLARLHHREALQRATVLHGLTKRLATGWATVAVEDLNVAGMTRSAAGTLDAPGRRVRQKSGLNRSVLDASPGEIRRQLAYKAAWYGSRLAVLDRWYPSSKTCSGSGTAKATLALSERTFTCTTCGLMLDRDVNAAVNIARFAVAPDSGETPNARGAAVSPIRPRTVTLAGDDRATPTHKGVPRSGPCAQGDWWRRCGNAPSQ